mgnify:CR=1 FL=1
MKEKKWRDVKLEGSSWRSCSREVLPELPSAWHKLRSLPMRLKIDLDARPESIMFLFLVLRGSGSGHGRA